MAVWCAGPSYAWRSPWSLDPEREVKLEKIDRDGNVRNFASPFTLADQYEIDAEINSYLEDAGIPRRPSGFRWFISLPRGTPDKFWWRLEEAVYRHSPEAIAPQDVYVAMSTVLPSLMRTRLE